MKSVSHCAFVFLNIFYIAEMGIRCFFGIPKGKRVTSYYSPASSSSSTIKGCCCCGDDFSRSTTFLLLLYGILLPVVIFSFVYYCPFLSSSSTDERSKWIYSLLSTSSAVTTSIVGFLLFSFLFLMIYSSMSELKSSKVVFSSAK